MSCCHSRPRTRSPHAESAYISGMEASVRGRVLYRVSLVSESRRRRRLHYRRVGKVYFDIYGSAEPSQRSHMETCISEPRPARLLPAGRTALHPLSASHRVCHWSRMMFMENTTTRPDRRTTPGQYPYNITQGQGTRVAQIPYVGQMSTYPRFRPSGVSIEFGNTTTRLRATFSSARYGSDRRYLDSIYSTREATFSHYPHDSRIKSYNPSLSTNILKWARLWFSGLSAESTKLSISVGYWDEKDNLYE